MQTLILKQSRLHFDGSHTGLSQLEGFSIMEFNNDSFDLQNDVGQHFPFQGTKQDQATTASFASRQRI
jgi:hypothetical protein